MSEPTATTAATLPELVEKLYAALKVVHALADKLEDLANEDEGLSETELPVIFGDIAESATDDESLLRELLEEVPHGH